MKPKKCIVCGEWFTPRFKTTERVCSVMCSISFATEKRIKKEKQDWQKEKKVRVDNLKTHSDWSKELQVLINEITRLIDKGTPCISSLRGNGQMQGGHRYSIGAFPALRFNLMNIHAQSSTDNNYKSGNPDGYDQGLELIYGLEYLNEVKELRQKYPVLKLTIPELIKAKARAKKIIKELKMLDMTYPARVRVELRKEYNKILGMYE